MAVQTPIRPDTETTSRTEAAESRSAQAELQRLGRVNRGLVVALVLVLAGLATAVALLLLQDDTTSSLSDATVPVNEAAAEYEAARQARSNEAWATRLEEAAAQYEAVRQSRSNEASATRLEEAAAQYEAVRRARALEADAARLTLQAEVRGLLGD